jgi:hypothetical protein
MPTIRIRPVGCSGVPGLSSKFGYDCTVLDPRSVEFGYDVKRDRQWFKFGYDLR